METAKAALKKMEVFQKGLLALFCSMTRAQLSAHIQQQQSFLCVGLDTDIDKLPAHLPHTAAGVLAFNQAIIDATRPYCVAYKLNTAFYEAMGPTGWEAMQATFAYIGSSHFTIADAKRGDIGNTSHQYARAFFEHMEVDALTVAPYMGEDSIRPFLEYAHKWTIVLGLTSNPGSADFERLKIEGGSGDTLPLVPSVVQPARGELLYQRVLRRVAGWGTPDNLMFVVGATQAHELEGIRALVPQHFLLVPGVGAQGGSLADVATYGRVPNATGLLVNASRSIIYASAGEDFALAAAKEAQLLQQQMANYIPKDTE